VLQVLNLANVFQNWLALKKTTCPLPTPPPVSVVVIKDWLRIPSALSQNSERS